MSPSRSGEHDREPTCATSQGSASTAWAIGPTGSATPTCCGSRTSTPTSGHRRRARRHRRGRRPRQCQQLSAVPGQLGIARSRRRPRRAVSGVEYDAGDRVRDHRRRAQRRLQRIARHRRARRRGGAPRPDLCRPGQSGAAGRRRTEVRTLSPTAERLDRRPRRVGGGRQPATAAALDDVAGDADRSRARTRALGSPRRRLGRPRRLADLRRRDGADPLRRPSRRTTRARCRSCADALSRSARPRRSCG